MTTALREGVVLRKARGDPQRRDRVRRGLRRGGSQGPPRKRSEKRAARPTPAAEGGAGPGGRWRRRSRRSFGMIQRTGEVVIRMLADGPADDHRPAHQGDNRPGSTVYTDEYDIYHRLTEWGYRHRTVCAMPRASSLGTRTVTGSARYTSTRWRGSGRCCGAGCARTGGFRRRSCRCTWVSSSSLHNVRRRGKALLGGPGRIAPQAVPPKHRMSHSGFPGFQPHQVLRDRNRPAVDKALGKALPWTIIRAGASSSSAERNQPTAVGARLKRGPLDAVFEVHGPAWSQRQIGD